MFSHVSLWPTWEEALCMFDKNVLEAMLACFRMFRFGPTWEEALCMFDQNFVEALPACFRTCLAMCHFWTPAQHVLHVSLLVQRGKRPCACLIETLWKRCWHVLHQTVCRPCLAMSYLRAGSDAGMFRFGPTWEKAISACLIETLWKRCRHVL